MHLFGVIHVAEGEWQSPNLRAPAFQQGIAVYAMNAVALSRSLKARGVRFSLLTNDCAAIRNTLERHGALKDLELVEAEFSLPVPSGLAFYSAHFKLDAYQYLAGVPASGLVGLVDVDMVAVGQVPAVLADLERRGYGMYYDISDQVIPAYGREAILNDMRSVDPEVVEGRWCGGEFLCGPPTLFRDLFAEVQDLFPAYARVASQLRSVGDEIVSSIALERLRRRGTLLGDAGTLGLIGRYWSALPLHPQKPFEYFEKCFLLHLPADKHFLARLNSVECAEEHAFLTRYKRYLLCRAPHRAVRRILNWLALHTRAAK